MAAEGRARRSDQRKDVAQDFDGLRRQGHERRRADVALHPSAHLHLLGRPPPKRQLEIDVLPIGQAQLPWSLKQHRRELQGGARNDVAVVASNVAQQLPELVRIRNGRIVPGTRRRQATGAVVREVFGRLQRSDINRLLEDMLNSLADALGCLEVAPDP